MNNPLLSVIIPIYNTAEYLSECLDSIINQTYYNLEIICVNDGSTDNSLDIIKYYSEKDSRILIINKENGGQSSARNAGIRIASGNLISFVDSDDVLSIDTYKKNISYFETDNELEMLQFPTVFNWKEKNEGLFSPKSKLYNEREDIFLAMWQNKPIIFSVCNKIFRKEIISSLSFNEDILYEDAYFLLEYSARAKKCRISSFGRYFYRWRNGSTSNSPVSVKKVKGLLFGSMISFNESLKHLSIPFQSVIPY